jgi:hypothetical protein
MHTSDGGDVVDEYLETVTENPGAPGTFVYKYGDNERPIIAKTIVVPYKNGGAMSEKKFTAYFSHHGPIVREANGKWVAIKLMQDPMNALTQSYQRTKARSYAEVVQVMQLRTNTSNNTVYADADGNIAYFHGNFIPVRDTQFDFTRPVDGSNPATEWKGLHTLPQMISLFNPKSGYIQNTNNHVQMSLTQWYQDYPAASDFLQILLGCGSFHPNSNASPNIAQFCNRAIQKQMDHAGQVGLTSPSQANKMWAQADHAITDQAPWVSMFNPKYIDVLSDRVSGYTFSPQWYMLLAQLSVK